MSNPQTFNAEQIAYMDKHIKRCVREELKRILDTGFMFTEEADMQMQGEKPAFKSASEKPFEKKFDGKHSQCFGTATTQDTCLQCKDNINCVDETLKRHVATRPEHAPQTSPKTELPFNPELCNWYSPEGKNYRMAKDGVTFKMLVAYLEAHDGKATVDGRFMWLFIRKDAIGWMLGAK